MSKFKTAVGFGGISIGSLVLVSGLIFLVGFGSLGYYKFFAPKYENAKREVFENTQSYNHGKVQDLAKYYEEFTKADESEKESIRQVIIMNFANFDSTKINNYNLRTFLVSQRGY